ncbi:2-octaprenyl-6-methoxyphenol hydroxylase [Luteibacter sp. UNC138MFCol5.1]|uniref:2-octaprenyl-6-methoxyphenyl hydroxylase n=1 Tax=Luteibacter sp. UNC138MFCol5.1 TaxID=1502774 RepID=UPI0008CF7BFD|nr:2-octaprenyl-6-methoxyphenyl hydroxylase [Luteibacter sp. UNC138MFCol5.1]SEO48255.1 2-octaprenyl-6-methoxyphenol hydroxylase [Luteibacter sp. UNC138MFCol5.1]
MTQTHPILIVGGGLVGASLAIALDAAGVPAILVEAAAPRVDDQPSYDERNLALARATVNGLDAIGVWDHARDRATPIVHIHTSRAGDFGSVRMDATTEQVDALGWTLPARELGAALLRRLDRCRHLTRLAPARVETIERGEDGWHVDILVEGERRRVTTPLLVGADGTSSGIRAQLGIGTREHDYEQALFVSTMVPERDPRGRAFERFTDDGPVAVLPLAERRVGVVLTVAADRVDEVAAMDDEAFLAFAQARFGWRLGRLTRPGKRVPYPIRRVAAESLVATRAVLVGNAAQTVHPIGAQGFNLGLRDALTLAELVAETTDPGSASMLAEYARRRAPDRDGTMAMSHGLIRLACLEQPFLGPLRSLAMLALDRVPPLRHALSRRGMGFRENAPLAVREKTP